MKTLGQLKKSSIKGRRPLAEKKVIESMGFHPKPEGQALRNLIDVMGQKKTIPASAFDAISIRNGASVDFSDSNDICRNLHNIVLIEIKTTARKEIGSDFHRYFFSISDRQIEVGKRLGKSYQFCLFNLETGSSMMLSTRQLFKKIRNKNTSYSVQL